MRKSWGNLIAAAAATVFAHGASARLVDKLMPESFNLAADHFGFDTYLMNDLTCRYGRDAKFNGGTRVVGATTADVKFTPIQQLPKWHLQAGDILWVLVEPDNRADIYVVEQARSDNIIAYSANRQGVLGAALPKQLEIVLAAESDMRYFGPKLRTQCRTLRAREFQKAIGDTFKGLNF